MADTETAKPAQLETWEEWEEFCLDALGREDPTLSSTHLYAIKAGARMIFVVLRKHFPSAATCQASAELLEAAKFNARVLSADYISYPSRKDALSVTEKAIAAAEPKK